MRFLMMLGLTEYETAAVFSLLENSHRAKALLYPEYTRSREAYCRDKTLEVVLRRPVLQWEHCQISSSSENFGCCSSYEDFDTHDKFNSPAAGYRNKYRNPNS